MVGGVLLGLITTAALIAIFAGYAVAAFVTAERFERSAKNSDS